MKSERDVKKKITQTVKSMAPHAWYCMPIGTGYGRQGIPDILICVRGRFIAIECKFGKRTATPLQRKEIGDLAAAGAEVFVVRDTDVQRFCDWLVKQ